MNRDDIVDVTVKGISHFKSKTADVASRIATEQAANKYEG